MLNGKKSRPDIASIFDVSLLSVQQWIRNYAFVGSYAFVKSGIRSKGELLTWIKKYNGHKKLTQK